MVKWQTHCLQEAALARAWEFKSPLGHKNKKCQISLHLFDHFPAGWFYRPFTGFFMLLHCRGSSKFDILGTAIPNNAVTMIPYAGMLRENSSRGLGLNKKMRHLPKIVGQYFNE